MLRRVLLGCLLCATSGHCALAQQRTPTGELVGDAPVDPGPLASISAKVSPKSVAAAMRKVADWQNSRISTSPSQDWTYATLYLGLLSSSRTLKDPRYEATVQSVAEHFEWKLGPRKTHADDQAIGQSYLWLYAEKPDEKRIAAIRSEFEEDLQIPDDPKHPVWWWCDALFMAPPVWARLAEDTHESTYLDYMDREWHISSDLLWDSHEHLFSRDATFLNSHEKNGRKVFWSRGNGWVMGGLVQVLEHLPASDPRRPFYVNKLREMASAVKQLQGDDGLWRPGLADAASYPYPETSGSAFFVYALAWGVRHGVLNEKEYGPVVQRGWAGLVSHIYADGRLGDCQPVGAAPGVYTPGASSVFGVGAFLLAGSEVYGWSESHPHLASLR
jgi:unsaturated rhamnogalacturonyl hydrolase